MLQLLLGHDQVVFKDWVVRWSFHVVEDSACLLVRSFVGIATHDSRTEKQEQAVAFHKIYG